MIDFSNALNQILHLIDFRANAIGNFEIDDPDIGPAEVMFSCSANAVRIRYDLACVYCTCGHNYDIVDCECEWNAFMDDIIPEATKVFTRNQVEKIRQPNLFSETI